MSELRMETVARCLEHHPDVVCRVTNSGLCFGLTRGEVKAEAILAYTDLHYCRSVELVVLNLLIGLERQISIKGVK